jgi:hypothetical protein
MGDLVMFRPASTGAARVKAPLRPEGAEILFFTGVRYERVEPLASTSSATPQPPAGGLSGAGRGRRKRRA